ncbi:PstS family phosphate ABC transporter substrate-binding protein [Candidatus Bathyarchaeota archaeon]|nr:PstS family phosphate ABC transporter substrate-binding protein [Candidatus Bathyarchaeota archaeon]
MKRRTTILTIVIIAIIAVSLAYWYNTTATQKLSGTIEIDGSSTVFPITQAVAEEFQKTDPDVRVNIGVSGTGGGFKRFTAGDTDISDASRPIKASEAQIAEQNGIEYIEFEIALDGLAVVVNKGNTWVDYMTVQELNMTWKPNSTVYKWSDIRPEWPDQPIILYGPGMDSGTFDYFTEVIVGTVDSIRSTDEWTSSEDDNVLVQGVAGDSQALGYFGYAYYKENTDKLKIVPIDSGSGPVTPSDETVNSGQYTPLSRPLFIYVNKESLARDEVKAFVRFYMENALQLVAEVGYTPLPSSVYVENLSKL